MAGSPQPERRGEGVDDGHRQRSIDLEEVEITLERICEDLRRLNEHMGDVEHELLALKDLPMRVASLDGYVHTLDGKVQAVLVLSRQYLPEVDAVKNGVEKMSGWKFGLQVATVIVVPLLIAIIGIYGVVLSAGSP